MTEVFSVAVAAVMRCGLTPVYQPRHGGFQPPPKNYLTRARGWNILLAALYDRRRKLS